MLCKEKSQETNRREYKYGLLHVTCKVQTTLFEQDVFIATQRFQEFSNFFNDKCTFSIAHILKNKEYLRFGVDNEEY